MKTHLLLNNKEKDIIFIDNKHYTISLTSIANNQTTNENEDSVGIIEINSNKLVFIVADGAGGFPKGEDASSLAIQTLEKQFEKNLDNLSPRTIILDAIEKINSELISKGNGARTTLLIGEFDNNKIRTYQIGDCELFVCGQKGKEKYYTTVHSPVGYQIAAGTLSREEAVAHPDRHYISNLLGDHEMRVEIGPWIELAPNDTVFMGTDGIFDNFVHKDLIELVRSGNAQDSTNSIIEKINSSQQAEDNSFKPDDISFILFRKN